MAKLCFGGSFNPIHHGHLICARAAAEALGFDRVVLVPSAQSPHKTAEYSLAPPHDRLQMCRLAAAEDPDLFEVDGLELSRTGPSYTIDTARELKRRGWPNVHWLIGADMVRLLPKWHEPGALLQEVQFVVVARPGWEFDWQAMPPEYRTLANRIVQAPLIDISATQIRQRVADERTISFLTPRSVCDYIGEHRLYR